MATEIVVPELGESIVEATVGRWLKQQGDPVRVGEAVVELETDKVDLEVGAERDGVLESIDVSEGQDVVVGQVLGTIDETAEVERQPAVKAREEEEEEQELGAQREPEPEPEPEPERVSSGGDGREPAPDEVEATPVARRLAEDHGVDLQSVPGSGPGGRVRKVDVEARLGEARGEEREAPIEEVTEVPEGERREERVRMSRRRRTIASRLREAQEQAVMLTTFNDADMSTVMEMREKHGERFRERYGVKLGITSFFIRAALHTLRQFPRLNAEVDGDDMVFKHYYDIGVAVGAEEGLVVPVLRNADRMSFAEIEREIRRFAQAAQDGSLTLEDLRGGTFSITNGGVFGSLMSTPILNPPQVGILGLHRIEQRPVALDGELEVRPMMYLALTYDHRIVDGREAVQFLATVKRAVEDPGEPFLFDE